MNVLLTGANGFIGRYLLAALVSAGHRVVPAVRRPRETDRLLGRPDSIAVDLNLDTRPEDWLPRLAGIDAVINCAGILQGRPGQSVAAIHAAGPKALFAACGAAGVRRVIQISAISAEPAAATAYAATKRQADDYLASTDLDWIVLRPSLVYAEGAFGGTALFRALSVLPFFVPVIGRGDQLFQPIHVDDLAGAILRLLDRPAIRRVVIDPVGPDTVTMRQVLVDLRRWLGAPPAAIVEIPLPLVRFVARLGDLLGGPINGTALRQLEFGNAGPPGPFAEAVGITPRRWADALLARPAQPQDRWHARLYFLRPLLRWSLAILWVASGVVGLLQPIARVTTLLAGLGITGGAGLVVLWATCLLDMTVGAALILRWRPALVGAVQIPIVLLYTIGLTWAEPALWADPFGPLLKNLPILVAIAILAALEHER